MYFFDDNQGIDMPSSWKLQYWNGSAYVDVPGASGYPLAPNQYNTVNFTTVSTTRLRVVLTAPAPPRSACWRSRRSAPDALRMIPAGGSRPYAGSAARMRHHHVDSHRGARSPWRDRPYPRVKTRRGSGCADLDPAQSAEMALRQPSWSRAWPGPVISAKRTTPVLSMRKVPRLA